MKFLIIFAIVIAVSLAYWRHIPRVRAHLENVELWFVSFFDCDEEVYITDFSLYEEKNIVYLEVHNKRRARPEEKEIEGQLVVLPGATLENYKVHRGDKTGIWLWSV